MMKPEWCPQLVWGEAVALTDGTMARGSYLFYERIARALLEAHQRGRREGMEEAAKVADANAHADCEVAEVISAAIRANSK